MAMREMEMVLLGVDEGVFLVFLATTKTRHHCMHAPRMMKLSHRPGLAHGPPFSLSSPLHPSIIGTQPSSLRDFQITHVLAPSPMFTSHGSKWPLYTASFRLGIIFCYRELHRLESSSSSFAPPLHAFLSVCLVVYHVDHVPASSLL